LSICRARGNSVNAMIPNMIARLIFIHISIGSPSMFVGLV
jgi:hypothetical protein